MDGCALFQMKTARVTARHFLARESTVMSLGGAKPWTSRDATPSSVLLFVLTMVGFFRSLPPWHLLSFT